MCCSKYAQIFTKFKGEDRFLKASLGGCIMQNMKRLDLKEQADFVNTFVLYKIIGRLNQLLIKTLDLIWQSQ